MSAGDLESDPDLRAWREERMNRHRRSSFEKDQLQYLRLNMPPSAVSIKGSISAYDIKEKETTASPPPQRRTRKISLAVLASPSLRKRRLSRAGTKVADMVRTLGGTHNNNNNHNNPQVQIKVT